MGLLATAMWAERDLLIRYCLIMIHMTFRKKNFLETWFLSQRFSFKAFFILVFVCESNCIEDNLMFDDNLTIADITDWWVRFWD